MPSQRGLSVSNKLVSRCIADIRCDPSAKPPSIIVSGGNGMDEININGENKILVPGQEIYNFSASSIGINNQDEKELDGGDAAYNANRIKEIFSGKIDAFYEIVLLNSAFALSLNDLDKLDNNVVKNNYLIFI